MRMGYEYLSSLKKPFETKDFCRAAMEIAYLEAKTPPFRSMGKSLQ